MLGSQPKHLLSQSSHRYLNSGIHETDQVVCNTIVLIIENYNNSIIKIINE